MIRHAHVRTFGASVLVALMVIGVGAAPVLGYSFAARASVTPTAMFVGDGSGTLLTFTVRNTGTHYSIGAVQISRPFSFWTILSCPSAPAGWSAVATASDCQYMSASGTTDDIARHASAAFTVVAATAPAKADRKGTWRVVVSQTNDFAQPSALKEAKSETPGLKTKAFSFELTDIVVANGPAVIGDPCPANNTAASSATSTLVACGVNHTNAVQRTRAPYSHLAGSLIKTAGTWHGGLIAPSADVVVLGNWSNVHLLAGTNLAITASVGAYPGRTSPSTNFAGYDAPVAAGADISPSPTLEAAKDGQDARYVETVTNTGNAQDSFSLAASGSWTAAVYEPNCTTPMSTTGTLAIGASVDVCVRVDVPGDAAEQATNDTTLSATSTAEPSVTGSGSLTTMAVQFDTLLVDQDTNDPVNSASYYKDALDTNGIDYGYWDLSENPDLPSSYLNKHVNVIWFTGNADSAPLSAYDTKLTSYLDLGGRLMMSGQDILDGSAGTSTFVHDYLHIDWDGTEVQNDKATTAVQSVDGNAVTDGIGSVPIDHSVLNTAFEDQITPISPGDAAFVDDDSKTDALTVNASGYKVLFLAFPFEAYGNASQKADLINRALSWFGA